MSATSTNIGNPTIHSAHPQEVLHHPVLSSTHHHSVETDVSFEEYLYYASITREEERIADEEFRQSKGSVSIGHILQNRFSKGSTGRRAPPIIIQDGTIDVTLKAPTQASDDVNRHTSTHREIVRDAEWRDASRAARISSWGTVAYLIVTDVLGPSGAP